MREWVLKVLRALVVVNTDHATTSSGGREAGRSQHIVYPYAVLFVPLARPLIEYREGGGVRSPRVVAPTCEIPKTAGLTCAPFSSCSCSNAVLRVSSRDSALCLCLSCSSFVSSISPSSSAALLTATSLASVTPANTTACAACVFFNSTRRESALAMDCGETLLAFRSIVPMMSVPGSPPAIFVPDVASSVAAPSMGPARVTSGLEAAVWLQVLLRSEELTILLDVSLSARVAKAGVCASRSRCARSAARISASTFSWSRHCRASYCQRLNTTSEDSVCLEYSCNASVYHIIAQVLIAASRIFWEVVFIHVSAASALVYCNFSERG